MKKYVLIESETHHRTPFRHFSDIINIIASKGFRSSISHPDSKAITMPHNRWHTEYYLAHMDDKLLLGNFTKQDKVYTVDLDLLTDTIKNSRAVTSWAGCGFLATDKERTELLYWYRDKEDNTIRNCKNNNVIGNSEILFETVMLMHGSYFDAPIFHTITNDDVVFYAGGNKINNQEYFVNAMTYHMGTLKDYVMRPGFSKAFEQDGVVIVPGEKFIVDFYARSGLKNSDFDFETLNIKIRSNLKYTKIDTGIYEFELSDQSNNYIYARIPADFGGEADPRTALRCAYNVYKS